MSDFEVFEHSNVSGLLNPNASAAFGSNIGAPVDEVNESEDILAKVFIPDWDNKPEERPAVLTLDGVSVLTQHNISSIVAAPGFGKSSIMEAICASKLNPECDSLGFECGEGIDGILYIDFERTHLDVWNSFSRMANRAGAAPFVPIENIVIAGFRQISRKEEKLEAIIKLLDANPCSLLLIDGSGDLVIDINSIEECKNASGFLKEIAIKYDLSVFTTIHPNPGTLKPRGHIGGEILRESESVLAVKKFEDTRVITSDFEHGKNRNSRNATYAYAWNEEMKMFGSTEVPSEYSKYSGGVKKSRKAKDFLDFPHEFHLQTLAKVFKKGSVLNSGDFRKALKAVWDKSGDNGTMGDNRARDFLSAYFQNDYIVTRDAEKGNSKEHEIDDKWRYDPLFC